MSKTVTLEPRETRISVRVDPDRKAVIARAAKIRQTTISDFVLENAYNAATKILADETRIVMTAVQFKHFCHALDNPPPASLAKMKKLLNTKTMFDE
jgi:uncharacterized protein (DUF1778 family)